ncbi:hypothetical protein F2Q69_00044157 [Brassica cretica]|uniref:Uncharacterized protein n=1 Tax=Brassica cretica TaxID=69181 RepID=A0A8S9NEI6_BRACR|nr:hypothetical protein F2Q69_00044157 [Brassica cretica]
MRSRTPTPFLSPNGKPQKSVSEYNWSDAGTVAKVRNVSTIGAIKRAAKKVGTYVVLMAHCVEIAGHKDAYIVIVLCTESVVCGLAFHTSLSDSPVAHPSFFPPFREGGMSHKSRLMEDVSNAVVTVSTPPDVELYSPSDLFFNLGRVLWDKVYKLPNLFYPSSILAKVRVTPLNPELV